MNDDLGKKIKKLRNAQELSLYELAIKAHLRPQTIQNIEKGKRKTPRIDTVQSIARALGVTVSLLLSEKAA